MGRVTSVVMNALNVRSRELFEKRSLIEIGTSLTIDNSSSLDVVWFFHIFVIVFLIDST